MGLITLFVVKYIVKQNNGYGLWTDQVIFLPQSLFKNLNNDLKDMYYGIKQLIIIHCLIMVKRLFKIGN